MKKAFSFAQGLMPLRLTLMASVLATAFAQPVLAQNNTLTIAMTAADIPRTLGQPDQGF
jgi:peptide/nickel transport system substrate-binding protein